MPAYAREDWKGRHSFRDVRQGPKPHRLRPWLLPLLLLVALLCDGNDNGQLLLGVQILSVLPLDSEKLHLLNRDGDQCFPQVSLRSSDRHDFSQPEVAVDHGDNDHLLLYDVY